MAETSPKPPPPWTSDTWAASKAFVRDSPTMLAIAIAAAMEPDALVPKPWLIGRSFSMVMSKPLPGASICATVRVIIAAETEPSMRMFTTSSSLSSTVATEPRLSLIPIPLDPVLRAWSVFMGSNTQET